MNKLDSQTLTLLYVGSNIVALLMLVTAWKAPRISRLMFFVLFTWAGYTNFTTALSSPQFYLEYADFSFFSFYKTLILGWFSHHITVVVCAIAACQAGVAVSMLLKGRWFKTGCIGGMVFLIAIAPFGLGSAFPCTLIMAAALWMLMRGARW